MLLLLIIPTPRALVTGFKFYSDSVQEILDCCSKLNGQHKSVRNRHEQKKPLKRPKKFRGDGNPHCGKTRSMSVTVKNINKSDQVL